MNVYAVGPGILLIGVALAMLIFGAMPIVAARLISLAFRRADPRRRELIAEVQAVPRWERPVWVGEQIARIFTEAIPDRIAHRFRPTMTIDTAVGGTLDLSGLFGESSELHVVGHLGRRQGWIGAYRVIGEFVVEGHEELFAVPLRHDQNQLTITVTRPRRNILALRVNKGAAQFTLPISSSKRAR